MRRKLGLIAAAGAVAAIAAAPLIAEAAPQDEARPRASSTNPGSLNGMPIVVYNELVDAGRL